MIRQCKDWGLVEAWSCEFVGSDASAVEGLGFREAVQVIDSQMHASRMHIDKQMEAPRKK